MKIAAARFLTVSLLFWRVASASAQTTAALTGSIVDPSGGVLPGVQVTITHAETGLRRVGVTGSDGRFVFAALPVGRYDLRAELAGFRAQVTEDLVLTVGETVTVPVVLQVGAVEELVTVRAGASQMNSKTPELSYLVGEHSIATLPLNGRNYTDLALLQPGTLSYPSRDGGSVVAHGLGMSINGQDYRSNVYLLDGTLQNVHERAGRQRGRHNARNGDDSRIQD
jgi:hypothetical protein